jgi:hypothetical protein
MSKYSILFEADDYHEIGPFRFPIYHDLTPGETKRFNKLQKEHAASTYRSMELAQKIAQDHKIKPSEALTILSNISSDDNQDYLFQYAAEVQELSDGVMNADEQRDSIVTAFMQMRGEAKMPDGWVRTDDWGTEDTDGMPGPLVKSIHEFINWERHGWPAPEGNEPEPEVDPPSSTSKRTSASKSS